MLSERSIGQIIFPQREGLASAQTHLLPAALQISDFITVLAIGTGAAVFYHTIALGIDVAELGTQRYWALSIFAAAGFVILGRALGSYHVVLPLFSAKEARSILTTWIILLASLMLAAFLLKNTSAFSRGTLIVFSASGYLGIVLSRWLCRAGFSFLIAKNIVPERKAILIQTTSPSPRLKNAGDVGSYKLDDYEGYQLVRRAVVEINDARKLRYIAEEIRPLICTGQVEEVLISIDHRNLSHAPEIQRAVGILPVPIHLILDPAVKSVLSRPHRALGRFLAIEIQRAPFSYFERVCKRTIDILVSMTAIAVFSPVMLITSAMIFLESGWPILFVQDRRGFSGRIFKIYKFRSMFVTENGKSIKQAAIKDPRITKIGAFIRRTSIDELPQLFNVIFGDMSIVGPRPHAVAQDDEYSRIISKYALRHHAKPGLTGLAQVRGLRGETPRIEDMEARIATDIGYINQWSIWFDLMIMARTAAVLLFQRNAR